MRPLTYQGGGSNIQQAPKSAINSAIRRGQLERIGQQLRSIS